jgi:[acyl-carrier-protein] S-malonyltransferase
LKTYQDNLLACFPGQGSQSSQMTKQLFANFEKIVSAVFEEAEDTTKMLLKKICKEADQDEVLKKTTNQQPAILATTYAFWKVLTEQTGIKSTQVYAGHSLGEYSALVAAEKLTFAQAIELVKTRAKAMQNACPQGLGAMAAVLNFPEDKLKSLCEQIATKQQKCLTIANYNSPGQLIISGHATCVSEASVELKEKKIRTIALPVSAPFHCQLMSEAKEAMQAPLQRTKIIENENKIIANLTGKISQTYSTTLLSEQIDHPVLWSQSLRCAYDRGIRNFIEIGPGSVLTNLGRKNLSTKECVFFNTAKNILTSIEEINNNFSV